MLARHQGLGLANAHARARSCCTHVQLSEERVVRHCHRAMIERILILCKDGSDLSALASQLQLTRRHLFKYLEVLYVKQLITRKGDVVCLTSFGQEYVANMRV
jgi:hypothetical protein